MKPKGLREIALAGIVVIALALAVYRVSSLSPAEPPPSQAARPAPVTSNGSPAPPPKATTDLKALDSPKVILEDSVRNPFRFKPKPPPPPPPVARATPPQQTGPVEPPPPPRIPLKFIGTMEIPKKGLVAVLSDGRGVYRGVEGQTIEGRYRIVRIGVESIDLAYLDGRGRQTIRLTGQ